MSIHPIGREEQLLGMLLRKFRKMNQITQTELASILEVSQSQINAIEAGKNPMRAYQMVILAKTYRLNPMWLLGLSKEMYIKNVEKGYGLKDKIPIQVSPAAKEL